MDYLKAIICNMYIIAGEINMERPLERNFAWVQKGPVVVADDVSWARERSSSVGMQCPVVASLYVQYGTDRLDILLLLLLWLGHEAALLPPPAGRSLLLLRLLLLCRSGRAE
jgi:hypothetical protein